MYEKVRDTYYQKTDYKKSHWSSCYGPAKWGTTTYWQERATADRKSSGDNVRAVIRNFVRLAK